jgi:hypothetical protein
MALLLDQEPLMAPPAGQVLGISIDVTADRAAMEMPGHGKLCQAFFDASDDTFLIEGYEGQDHRLQSRCLRHVRL